jgi:hypothetical protein
MSRSTPFGADAPHDEARTAIESIPPVPWRPRLAAMAEPESTREDLQAAVAARRELGRDYEDAVLDSFLDRVDRSIAARVDARVAERLPAALRSTGQSRGGADPGLVLGLASVVTGIPITAIAGGTSGVEGIIVAWAGISVVNLAHAWGRRLRGGG